MKPDLAGALPVLQAAAYKCAAIVELANLGREADQSDDAIAAALTAIVALAECVHDRIDFAYRCLDADAGLGYLCPIRRELDELVTAARGYETKGGDRATS